MPKVNVNQLMTGYASSRGISVNEVKDLEKKVGYKPSPTVLKDLKKARTTYKDDFGTPAKTEYDRFVGLFELKNGKTVEAYGSFNDLWKIDTQSDFRAKWGITSKDDPRAPTFTKNVTLSSVPANLKTKFLAYAERTLKNELEPGHHPALESAERIYDLNHKPIGWAISSDVDGFTGYYRNDGTPAGLSANPPVD